MEEETTNVQRKRLFPEGKSIRDYVGWIGFIVTAGVLLRFIYISGLTLNHYFGLSNEFRNYYTAELSSFMKLTWISSIITSGIFFLFPLLLLALMAFRRRIVPRLLIIFAITAIASSVWAQIETVILAAQYAEPIPVRWKPYLFLAAYIAMLVFYLKSKQFRAVFNKPA